MCEVISRTLCPMHFYALPFPLYTVPQASVERPGVPDASAYSPTFARAFPPSIELITN